VASALNAADAPLVDATAVDDVEFFAWWSEMKDPGDAGGGAAPLAGVGFDILDGVGGAPAATALAMKLEVFDDALCTVPSVNATLDTAAVGAITAGAGTNSLEVTPAAGVFSCTLSDAADETVYLKSSILVPGAALIITSDIDDVTFSA